MLAVLAGHDESDACSVDRPVDDYVGALTGDVEGLRIGVVLPSYHQVSTASRASKGEALSYHRRDLQQRWSDYGRGTRASLVIGACTTAADYAQAQRVRRVAVRAVAELFAGYDLTITPTSQIPPLPLDGLSLLKILRLLNMSYWNGVGCPAMSIPMGLTSAGLPVGLQLAGRPFERRPWCSARRTPSRHAPTTTCRNPHS